MHLGLFPAYFDHPHQIRFEGQESNERIELFLRQHPILNVPWIVITIGLVFVPSVVPSFLNQISFLNFGTIPVSLSISLTLLWYMLVVAYVIERFLKWYFNIYIVTNLHVVDVNFYNILYRDKVEIRLEDIQSSKPSVKGVVGSMFHYGDIIIETSAERQRIEFHAVPRPDLVAERIQDLQRVHEEGGDGAS